MSRAFLLLTSIACLPAAFATANQPTVGPVAAEVAVAESALTRMPVTEITVFKDGHAFVVHEGELPTNEQGQVLMDYLPTPVLGTFWPYSADEGVKLTAVTAGQRTVSVERTAMDVRALLEANVGARVIVKIDNATIHATIGGLPSRSSDELAATSPPNTPPQLPLKGSLILLETAEGVRVTPIERIQEVTFRDPPKPTSTDEEFRNVLTLKFAWPAGRPAASAKVGMAYLQRGIRWIPNYKITIDGEGKAHVQLNATILNEMADLNDVNVNLVIGVPTFAFKDTVDPISLQQAAAQLSPYFQESSQTGFMLSNSIMTQTARMGEYREPAAAPPTVDLGPQVGEGEAAEDLFVFNVQHVSLKKGERMVLPVVEFDLEYRDVYTLDLPIAPPPEVRQQFNDQQQQELARLFHAPKVMHKIRLTNGSDYPLTTAPALIVRGERVLAQGMMTYTSRGATTDLTITAAVNVPVTRSDTETGRTPNAAQWNGETIARIDLQGKIHLNNFSGKPIALEVTRHVLGIADEADREATVEQVNLHDEGWRLAGGDYPYWWSWYNWPYWWRTYNGIGRIEWKLNLDAGAEVDLGYTWHYFGR